MDVDEDSPYVACVHCGKDVFAGVSECPYCLKDPSGEAFGCANCGRDLPPDAAQCPYCGNYTDGGQTFKAGARKDDDGVKRWPKIFVIAAWLAILGTIAPLAIQMIEWLRRR